MNPTWVIAKRELNSYFDSLIAYLDEYGKSTFELKTFLLVDLYGIAVANASGLRWRGNRVKPPIARS